MVDHADEEVTFAAEDGIYAHFELNVAIEDVKWSLAEDYAMLLPIFLKELSSFLECQSLGAPLRVEGKSSIVHVSYIDGGINNC